MKYVFFLFLILNISSIEAQSYQVTAKIINKSTQQTISSSTIKITNSNRIFSADKNGYFVIENLKKGIYNIEITSIGFKKLIYNFEIIDKDLQKTFELEESIIELLPITIVDLRVNKSADGFTIPIEIIQKKEFENSTRINISEIVEKNPGISIAKDSPWGSAINIRGLGNSNVVYLVDGSRIETSTNIAGGLSMFNLDEIEQIEIVKGGLSSIYGTGATGGVVSINTNRERFTEKLILNFGGNYSYNSVNQGNFSNLLIESMNNFMYLKLNSSFRKADDSKTPNGTLTNSQFEDKSYNGLLSFLLIENLKLNFEYQKYSATNVGIPGGSAFTETSTATYKKAERELISTSLNWINPFLSFTELNLKFYKQVIFRDTEVIPNANVIVNPVATHTTLGSLLQGKMMLNSTDFMIMGIEAWQREYDGIRSTFNISANEEVFDKPVPNSTYADLGMFVGMGKYLFAQKLMLDLGIRYDLLFIENEQTNNPQMIIQNGSIVIPPANNNTSYSANFVRNNSFAGNFGMKYHFSDELFSNFNIAYAFRSPSLEERYQYINLGGLIYLGNPELKPEISNSYDISIGYKSTENYAKIGCFLNNLTNLVIDEEIVNDSLYQKQNVGEAIIYGIEMTYSHEILSNLSVETNGTWLVGINQITNENLPQIPPINAKIGVNYNLYNNLEFNIFASFYVNQENPSPTESETSGYSVYDFKIIYKPNLSFLNKLSLIFGVDNIFDREYRNHLSTYRGISLIEPGRNVFLKINFMY